MRVISIRHSRAPTRESIPGVGPLVLRLSKHVLSLVEGYERGDDHALPIRHLGHPPHSPNPPAIQRPREESGACPLTDHFSSSPGTELGACRCALAHLHAPIHPSPSPLMALRERGTEGERVPCPGRNTLESHPPPLTKSRNPAILRPRHVEDPSRRTGIQGSGWVRMIRKK